MSFDTINEWPDIIGFLTRLHKVFQTPCFPIPRKLLLSKRLAQCLNPALPTGVHQKCLEVYNLVLDCYDTSQLELDLSLWSYGLFSFCSFAAVSCKPHILNIYERFYLPLGDKLVTLTKGLLLAILPVLEEENNDFFQRGFILLSNIANAVPSRHFYNSMWRGLFESPQSRMAGINFLVKFMGRKDAEDNLNSTSFSDCFSSLLTDKAMLVNRGTLDILIKHFSVQQSSDVVLNFDNILVAALSIVLRRDMSLNRRLFQWIDVESNEKRGTHLVQTAIKLMLKDPSDIKTYHIMISLLDKVNLGINVIGGIFWDLVHQAKCSSTSKQNFSLLFEMLDSFFIWSKFALSVKTPTAEILDLIKFLLDSFAINDEESEKIHRPYFYFILSTLIVDEVEETLVNSLFALLEKICKGFSPLVFTTCWKLKDYRSIRKSITVLSSANTDQFSPLPFSPSLAPTPSGSHEELDLVVDDYTTELPWCINAEEIELMYCSENSLQEQNLLDRLMIGEPAITGAYKNLASYDGKLNENNLKIWNSIISQHISMNPNLPLTDAFNRLFSTCLAAKEFETFQSCTDTILQMVQIVKSLFVDDMILQLFSKFWEYWQPKYTLFHEKMYTTFENFCHVCTHRLVEQYILLELGKMDDAAFVIFGSLWRRYETAQKNTSMIFKRPILIIMSKLLSGRLEDRNRSEAWIKTYVNSPSRIVNPLLDILRRDVELTPQNWIVNKKQISVLVYTKDCNLAQIDFSFGIIEKLFEMGPTEFLQDLEKQAAYEVNIENLCTWTNRSFATNSTDYSVVLILASLSYMQAELPDTEVIDKAMATLVDSLHVRTCQLLISILSIANVPADLGNLIYTTLMKRLKQAILMRKLDAQPTLLQCLTVISYHIRHNTEFQNSFGDSMEFFALLKLAFCKKSNRPVIDHWVNLFKRQIPLGKGNFSTFYLPLLQTLCKEMIGCMDESSYILMPVDVVRFYLDSVQWICSHLLKEEKQNIPTSFLPQFASDLFQFEKWTSFEGAGNEILTAFPMIISCLHLVFEKFSETFLSGTVKELLNVFFKKFPQQTLESLIRTTTNFNSVHRLMLLISSDPKNILSHLCHILRNKNADATDCKIITSETLRNYIQFFIGKHPFSLPIETWNSLHEYFNFQLAHALQRKCLFPRFSRFMHFLFLSNVVGEPRIEKEAQEIWCKCLDYCNLIIGRAFDHGPWKKSTPEDPFFIPPKQLSWAGFAEFGILPKEKEQSSTVLSEDEIFQDVLQHLTQVLPALNEYIENDRIQALLTSMLHTFIIPCLRKTSISMYFSKVAKLMIIIASFPNGFKLWRREVWDGFMDSKFFSLNSVEWEPIMQSLLSNDPDKFMDLLAKINATTIFGSMELEVNLQCQILRKISYCVFISPTDYFKKHLPNLQEKLTQFLKGTEEQQNEALLCLCCLFLKMSNMTNYWPTVSHFLIETLDTLQPSMLLVEQSVILIVELHILKLPNFSL